MRVLYTVMVQVTVMRGTSKPEKDNEKIRKATAPLMRERSTEKQNSCVTQNGEGIARYMSHKVE
jgi:hypothetical protein